ncbi:hypothetical protein RQP46_002323 [Phenoliferia psychrophenolica]
MASDLETLQEFGFSATRAKYALKKTKNAGLQQALDYLGEHEEEPTEADLAEDEDELMGDVSGADGLEAKSLKCLQCNKIFKNNALASYHGEKSGHDQFEESTEEIKPLTEEERVAKLADLKERMLEKKKINAKKELEDQKANAAIQRKQGKDSAAIKAEMELKEAQKAAIERKADKLADLKAKNAVRAQIEADKVTRAAKFAKEKALRDGKAPPVVADAPKAAPKAPGEKVVYDSARLQIRLPNGGQALVTSMPASSTLGDLAKWVKEQPSAASLESLVFVSAFPRKVFGDADNSKTLTELGLVPSASLMIQ